ncbi:hypothetical protein EJ03DRAFT_332651 [Teratosphaeria nubilosa]|uniref:Uncharacterized protein n=1 Tax=Teratosphaeria nubilosa TaxID=161662 RepID=A0A6G1LNC9_9PEZI|nr:hypothetical protein EJ03DRAFT_332651 [Teratosphaeria nubilosa]
MDWTGGARRRFAAGKKHATLQKQKAHFAKFRATLQNSSRSQRSFQPDYGSVKSSYRTVLANVARDHRPHVRNRSNNQAAPKRSRSRSPRIEASSAGVAHSEASSPCKGPPYSSSACNGESFVPPARRDAVPQSLTDEELLRSSKQRLLARSDWLGLSKKRSAPAIRFPSASDRDDVGKRRKIRKSHHYSKPAGPRAHTPIFEERIPNANAFMNGGLLAQNFDIWIGTEALATQTAPSQHSQPSRHTSMRQPSTELGPLSEEPMLLGDDGDSYDLGEALTESIPSVQALTDASHLIKQHPITPFNNLGGSRRPEHLHTVSDTDTARDDSISSTALEDQNHASINYSIELSHAAQNFHRNDMAIDDQLRLPQDLSRQHSAKDIAICSPGDVIYDRPPSRDELVQKVVDPATDHAHEEDLWRMTVGVQHEPSSHASVAALKSSSTHQTNSDSDYRAAAAVERARIDQGLPLPSTPKGRGTQAPAFSVGGAEDTTHPVTDPSLPASLELYDRLARVPAPVTEPKTWEADETHALWRDFCGVDDYKSESSEQPGNSEATIERGDQRRTVGGPTSMLVHDFSGGDKQQLSSWSMIPQILAKEA